MSEVFDSNYGVNFSLYKIKNTNNFYYYFRYKKNPYRGSTKTPDIKQSKIYVIDLIHDLIHGIVQPRRNKKGSIKNPTFSKMYDYFIEDKKNELTPRVIDKNNGMSRFLKEYFGDWVKEDFLKFESDILYTQYQQWRKSYYQDRDYFVNGQNLRDRVIGNITINKECGLLHNILNHNQKYRGLLVEYRIPSFSRRNNVKKVEHPRTKIPTVEQYKKIKSWYLEGNNFHGRNFNEIYHLYIRFLCNVGCRVGESLMLTIDDIDYKNQVIWIKNRKSNKGNIINTGFPMVGKIKVLIDRILEITEESREKTGVRTLFVNPERGKPLGNIRKSFNRCMKELNCYYDEEKKTYFSIGCFRHYFITKMIKQDIPLPLLARLVGHTEVSTIQKNYISLRTEDLVKSMNDVFNDIERRKEIRKKYSTDNDETIEGLTSFLDDI